MSVTSTTENKSNTPIHKATGESVDSKSSLWYRLTLGAVGLTILIMVAYLILALSWRSRPFLGLFTTHGMVVNAGRPASGLPWNGLDAGIQQGDVIRSINGESLSPAILDFTTAQQNLTTTLSNLSVGDEITVTVQRSESSGDVEQQACSEIVNGVATCEYNVILQQIPDGDFIAFFVLPFITGIIVLSVGIGIIYLRRNQNIASLATLVCMITAIHTTGIFDVGTTWTLIPLWMLATIWIGGLLIVFGLRFPNKLPITYSQPVVLYVPFVVTALLSATAFYAYVSPETPAGSNLALQVVSFYLIGSVVVFAAIIIGIQRPRSVTLARRDQTNTLIVGIVLIIIPAMLYILSRVIGLLNPQAALGISIEATMPFYITSSLAIAYSILQYRQFNTDRVISQTVTYGIMLSILIVGYFLLVTGLAFVTQGAIRADNPILIALTMFGMVMFFSPLRNALQQRIDTIYYKTRYNYQQSVEQFNQKLTSLVNFEDIISEFETVLEDSISPSSLFIFLPRYETGDYEAYGSGKAPTDIRFSPHSGIVLLLSNRDELVILDPDKPLPKQLLVDQSRINLLKPAILAGLSGSGKLNGFVSIGLPRSTSAEYTFEEVRFLNNIIAQLAIAIERAQVIDSLQRELKKLDVLSQVGQAVNFTIRFDDLLELIYAQTFRLIDVPNFYIALHDTNANQLYFAFFLEDDDRIEEKENERWTSMDDLIHAVFNSSQAMNIADFAQEMTKRGATITHESPHLKAWMAVPLVSGTRKLGVLAVGKSKVGELYTDEQFKILDDIGALAASSLDRLRLFNETNMRARQLQALNDISRQLAASELEVDGLLEVIMSSAVEIINTEAGSLLLVPEDNEEELEFKVVVGGSGEELIGSRLKRGQGVVGQVAETGQPVIENDVAQNTQHTDVDEDFATQSLLAVPLIAKERVIGVLEVINKKDKTLFVQDDVDLLTTFAGQAGVAIENARLFEMTDQQLAQRVAELEILESIDSQLNRTLDIGEVARITVEAAMDNTNAQAGALGIVTGTPAYLQIVALKGYEEEDYPAGADGLQWSLERGVLQRVMRSRQADIVYDTNIDPDYETALRGSISQITVPMMSADEINAILILETNEAPPFNLGQWAFSQRLAEHASIAIANAQLYAELTRANESKSEFMGFAAHELKNPLTSIKGYSELMTKGIGNIGKEQQLAFWEIIGSNANRMQTIIDDLRDFARLEAGQLNVDLAPMDLRPVINESVRSLQKQFDEKHQKVHIDMPEPSPMILADSIRLTQVIVNILSNASKYSDTDKNIYISAEVKERFKNKRGQNLGTVLHVAIKDEGFGMSDADLARLFNEKYFRSENPVAHAQPGTGLGMMITYSIMQLHKGDIWVESELEVGSTFNFVIPLAPEEPAEQVEEKLPETEPASD